MIALVLFNALIFRRGHAGEYHFMDFRAASKLLACESVNPAYAGLNWFACVTKRRPHLSRRPATPSTLRSCNVL
jgi:hypothetical protein